MCVSTIVISDRPQEYSGNLYWSLVDCGSYAALQFHLEDLGIIPLHGGVQLGHFHLNVLDGHFYRGQHYLLLLGNLNINILPSVLSTVI